MANDINIAIEELADEDSDESEVHRKRRTALRRFFYFAVIKIFRTPAPKISKPASSLMSELTAENSSGNVVKGNVKFSIAEDGNLNVLTATANP